MSIYKTPQENELARAFTRLTLAVLGVWVVLTVIGYGEWAPLVICGAFTVWMHS